MYSVEIGQLTFYSEWRLSTAPEGLPLLPEPTRTLWTTTSCLRTCSLSTTRPLCWWGRCSARAGAGACGNSHLFCTEIEEIVQLDHVTFEFETSKLW